MPVLSPAPSRLPTMTGPCRLGGDEAYQLPRRLRVPRARCHRCAKRRHVLQVGWQRPTSSTPTTGMISAICWNADFRFAAGDSFANHDGMAVVGTDQPGLGLQFARHSKSIEQTDQIVSARAAGGRIGIGDRLCVAQQAFERLCEPISGLRRPRLYRDADTGTRPPRPPLSGRTSFASELFDRRPRRDGDVNGLRHPARDCVQPERVNSVEILIPVDLSNASASSRRSVMAPAHSTLMAVPINGRGRMAGALQLNRLWSSWLDSACVGEGPVPVAGSLPNINLSGQIAAAVPEPVCISFPPKLGRITNGMECDPGVAAKAEASRDAEGSPIRRG